MIEQMTNCNAYAPTLMKTAVSLYLRSPNCYQCLESLFAPIQTLSRTILASLLFQVNYMNVKIPLSLKKYCKILFDKIHVKLAIHDHRSHVIDYSHWKLS